MTFIFCTYIYICKYVELVAMCVYACTHICLFVRWFLDVYSIHLLIYLGMSICMSCVHVHQQSFVHYCHVHPPYHHHYYCCCISTYMHAYKDMYTDICVDIYIYIHIHTHTHTYVYIYAYVLVYVYMYVWVDTHPEPKV